MTVGGFTKTKSAQTNVIQFNGGVLKAGANNTAFLPAFTVSSNWVQSGGAKIDDGGFAITIAAPLLHDPIISAAVDGLTKLGTGTLTLAGSNTYMGTTTVNAGTLALSAAGAINSSSSICLAAAGTFDSSAVGTYTLGNGKKLWGNGAVNGAFTLGSGAVLEPGTNGIGRLTFSNAVTFAANSTNSFQLSKSPLTNDAVKVDGALTNGGTLIVSNVSGTLAVGDSFRLFNAASYSGAFSTVILPALDTGRAWNTNQLNTAGVISVVSSTPPVFGSATLSGGGLVVSGSNGPPYASYYVLTSTNVTLPMLNWTRAATNQFAADGRFVFTNPVPPGLPVLFQRLQLP